MDKNLLKLQYIIADILTSSLTWTLFYLYRKFRIEPQLYGLDVSFSYTPEFFKGLIIIPLFFLVFNFLIGFYTNPQRKSRIIELGQTILISILGCVLIFFYAVLNDPVSSHQLYYNQFFTLFALHSGLTYLARVIITSRVKVKIANHKIGFNTLIVGCNQNAVNLYHDFLNQKRTTGNIFRGFVMINNEDSRMLEKFLPNLGTLDDLGKVIDDYEVEEVIIAIESKEHHLLEGIINKLGFHQVLVKVIPNMFDIASGLVKTSTIYSSPLMDISTGVMSPWEENMKRLIDITFSIIATILFLPLFIAIGTTIKATSPGPVLFKQKRVGRYGKLFSIYKLRSMYIDAEKDGPALSSPNDSRITKIGRFIRKTHLDEIPQFYNVLRGDMSLVGPRPEREYFLEKINKRTPQYIQLHKIRPGITSWGQIKYGYAENVDEMIERMPYDLVYLRNMSIYLDLRILTYTILDVVKGKGK